MFAAKDHQLLQGFYGVAFAQLDARAAERFASVTDFHFRHYHLACTGKTSRHVSRLWRLGNLWITDPLLAEWANFCRASGAERRNRAASIFAVFAAQDH